MIYITGRFLRKAVAVAVSAAFLMTLPGFDCYRACAQARGSAAALRTPGAAAPVMRAVYAVPASFGPNAGAANALPAFTVLPANGTQAGPIALSPSVSIDWSLARPLQVPANQVRVGTLPEAAAARVAGVGETLREISAQAVASLPLGTLHGIGQRLTDRLQGATALSPAQGPEPTGPGGSAPEKSSAELKPAAPPSQAVDRGPVPASKKIAKLNLLRKKDPDAAFALAAEMLQDPEERRMEVRISALRVILGSTGARVADPLGLLLSNTRENWYLRREAARGFGQHAAELTERRADVVQALQAAYLDDNGSIRLMAKWALERFNEQVEPERGSLSRPQPRRSSGWSSDPAPEEDGAASGSQKPAFMKWVIGATAAALLVSLMFSGNPQRHEEADVAPPPAIEQVMPAKPSPAPEIKLDNPRDQAFVDALKGVENQVKRSADATDRLGRIVLESSRQSGGGMLWSLLLMLAGPALLIWFMMKRMGGGGAGGGMGLPSQSKGKALTEKPTTRFSDVAGVEDALTELREIVEFLRDPARFNHVGARVPKGVLLEGPPGTGKTLLARALAGEANAHFITISGSDFVELFVGMGASRVRKLFEDARKTGGPTIIFIDEIDAVGKARGGGGPVNNDEREQTINALLAEMSGFNNDAGIVVIAATNRADILDPALTRPGRFDRKVYVGPPEVLGREAILAVHGKRVRLAPEVDLPFIARRTPGLAGAFLENVINEAAVLAARRSADSIDMQDMHEAVDRAQIGQKRNLVIEEKLKRRIAYHESGHTLGSLLTPNGNSVNKVTIIPHGSGALGWAESGTAEDKYLYTKAELEDRLVMILGGLAAEEVIYGEASSGPGSDLEQATRIARTMVEKLGMSKKVGLGVAGASPSSPWGGRNVSEDTAREIDIEVKRILDEAHARVTTLLTENRSKLEALVAALMEKESLTREEIEAIVYDGKARPQND